MVQLKPIPTLLRRLKEMQFLLGLSLAMQLVQLIIPMESAHLTVSYLGELDLLQFKDLNAEKSPFQRTYAGQLKRCGEMARKLRFFKEQMLKAGVLPLDSATQVDTNIDDLEICEYLCC